MGVSELNVIGLIIIAAQSTPGFAPNMKFQRHKIKPPEQATTAGISDMICIYNIPGNKVEPAIAPLMQCRCCARCFCSRASRETKEICPEPVGGGANTPRTRVFFEDLSDIYGGHHWTNTSPCQAIWLHKSVQQRQEVVPRRFFVPYSRWTKRSNPSKPPGPKFHCCTKLYIASLALGFVFLAHRPRGPKATLKSGDAGAPTIQQGFDFIVHLRSGDGDAALHTYKQPRGKIWAL